MSSMLRQHHVKIQDLVSYLRGYDPSKPQTAEDWSKQESAGFEPGMLIFCLERVSAPSGLAFGKKDTEGETYRVKDLCVVVGRDNNRSLVVNITASAFELRYLEVLMLEKARKAILDGKDFLYVAVKPAQPLPESKLREIEELGAMYAQGGSRRSLVVDASGPQEPAVALLAALGVKLSVGGIGKQVLDIGSICHMLFAPEGRQEDKNKALVKACFAAIPNNEPIGHGGQSSAFNGTAPRAQRVPSRPAPSQPPQTVEWGPPPTTAWAQDILPQPEAPQAPPLQNFGYDQAALADNGPPQTAFGYDQPVSATAPATGFGYEQPLPASGDPSTWGQPAAAPPAAGFGADISGLNPFAPPGPDLAPFGQLDDGKPDFASQFKDDLEKGLAGEAAIRFEQDELAREQASKWTPEAPRAFSQEEYSQKFAPPPDLDFDKVQETADYTQQQFPPPTDFSNQQFNDQQFKTPDFGQPFAPEPFGGAAPLVVPTEAEAQDATLLTKPVQFAPEVTQEDFFKPPYEEEQEEPQLPPELTAELDPQNQLFQAAAAGSAESPPTDGEPAKVSGYAFGIEALSQQPPGEFVDSIFDSTRGAFEKTSRAMSFDDDQEAEPATPPSMYAISPNAMAFPTQMDPEPAKAAEAAFKPAAEPPAPWPPAEPALSIDKILAAADAGTQWSADSSEIGGQPLSGWAPEPAVSETPAMPPAAVEPVSTWAPEPTAEPISGWPAVEAESASPTTESAPESPAAPESSGPTLFERLNQQLQKGSISEIEPPPETSFEPEPEEVIAAPHGPINPEATLVLKIPKELSEDNPPSAPPTAPVSDAVAASDFSAITAPGDFSAAVVAHDLAAPTAASDLTVTSGVSDPTSLAQPSGLIDPVITPEPAEAEIETKPLPLGVSKKGAPLILDWPSAPVEETKKEDSITADGIKHLAEALSGLMDSEPQPVIMVPSSIPSIASEPSMPNLSTSPSEPHNASLDALASGEFAVPAESPEATSGQPADPAPNAVLESAPAAAEEVNEFEPVASAALEQVDASPTSLEAPPLADAQAADVMITEPQSSSSLSPETTYTLPAVPDGAAPPAVTVTEAPPAVPAAEAPPAVPVTEAPEEEFEEEEEEELSPSAALAAKGFQEPRLVMNEMASLMSKLEQQVQKAAKKMNSRADEIKMRLHKEVDALVENASEIEKDSQRSIANLAQRLSKQLDDASEEVRLKLSDVAANGRYTIKQLLTSNQNQVDENRNSLYESLKDACKQFRIETEALARTADNDLNELIKARSEELDSLVKLISTNLDDTNSGFSTKLTGRFDRFKERMSEESSSVIRSLERNVRSMVEEIDRSWDRASEKLKASKNDFDQTIQFTVRTAELNLSQNTRRILTNSLIPKLRERRERLRATSIELSRRFTDESEGQVSGQILGLEASLAAARQQLQALVDECMSSIDMVGRGQQAGLEEIFKETSVHAERATNEVTELLQKIESQISENELSCKRLAETSSVDTDPDLTEDRKSATARVQQLKQQANSELSSAIEAGCSKLEQVSQRVQSEVTNLRIEHTQTVRDAAENGLTRVRDAIQEAFSAIQAAREKYME